MKKKTKKPAPKVVKKPAVSAKPSENLDSVLSESRKFKPLKEFSKNAHLGDAKKYKKLWNAAWKNPVAFWAQAAREDLRWQKPFKKTLDKSKAPFFTWFADGQLNVSDNCLDRHCEGWRKNKAALIWEGEPNGTTGAEVRTFTYGQLLTQVCKCENVLKKLGVKQGDRVTIYMPLVPEAVIAMLACTRIGAVHSVIFGGFSAEAVRDRVADAQSKLIITADGGYRKGAVVELKKSVDQACAQVNCVESVVVLKRTGSSIAMKAGRDHYWHDLMADASAVCPPEKLSAEHPLFILYTSGTTGKPKGVLHSTGGYLTHVARTTRWTFDLKDEDVYWCTADIGWVTGHSYLVYGVLANGATALMYEGAPNFPQPDRIWDIIERHRVTILYTAPTAIRSFIRSGDDWVKKHDLSSLRLLGSVGEPINPEAWMWYHTVVGKKRCPIVDTWWQTETGGILISPMPGITEAVPGSATQPFPGVRAEVVDKRGKPVPAGSGGFLVISHPWPGMLRTVYGDPERFKKTYFGEIPGIYFTGDGARKDKSGNFWVLGRVDDVVNISGHRLGTAEVESALVSNPKVAEAAVVGRPDDLKGQALVAFVTLKSSLKPSEEIEKELKAHVAKEIGALARPDEVRFAEALPKTRSGKIMRRLLRELATSGKVAGDTTTLEDFGVLEKLRADED